MPRDASVNSLIGVEKRRAATAATTTARARENRPTIARRPATFATALARNVYGSDSRTWIAYGDTDRGLTIWTSVVRMIGSLAWPGRGGDVCAAVKTPSGRVTMDTAPLESMVGWPIVITTLAWARRSAMRLLFVSLSRSLPTPGFTVPSGYTTGCGAFCPRRAAMTTSRT